MPDISKRCLAETTTSELLRVDSQGTAKPYSASRSYIFLFTQHAALLTLRAAAETTTSELRRVNSAGKVPALHQLQSGARRERRNSFSEFYSWEGLQVRIPF